MFYITWNLDARPNKQKALLSVMHLEMSTFTMLELNLSIKMSILIYL